MPFSPSGWASPVYLFVYLLIYLFITLFNLLASPGMVWLSQLDWEVREPSKERDSKGHRGLSATPTHPISGSEGEAPPSSEPELAGEEGSRMGGIA